MELLIAPFEERLKQLIWESFTDKFYLCLKQFALALFFCRILAKRKLRWLVGLKLIQLEQQKTQLSFIILAKKLKPILCRVTKGTSRTLSCKKIICAFKS